MSVSVVSLVVRDGCCHGDGGGTFTRDQVSGVDYDDAVGLGMSVSVLQ